jgi:hypothetical protein
MTALSSATKVRMSVSVLPVTAMRDIALSKFVNAAA